MRYGGDVLANGDVAYLEQEPDPDFITISRVVLYAGGIATPLTDFNRYGSHIPEADGTTTLYFLNRCLPGGATSACRLTQSCKT